MNNSLLFLALKTDSATLIFLLIFMLLTIVKLIYDKRLIRLIKIGFSKKYFLNFGKDNQLIFNAFNSILFAIQSLIAMLIIYAYLHFYHPIIIQQSSFLMLKIIFSFVLIFLIRFLVGKSLALLFEVKNEHNYISFEKMSYLFSVFLFTLPVLLLVFYSKSYNLLFFHLLIVLLLTLLIIRYIFIFKNNKKRIANQLFYFILYLCALEIAPIFIVLKLFDKIVII